MPLAKPVPSRPSAPIPIDARAAENLRYIRETMERAGSFTAVPGWGGVAMGTTALIAAMVATRQTRPSAWLLTWLVESVLAFTIASLATWQKARSARMLLVSGPARKFALSFVPPLAAGALLTFILFRAGSVAVLPGLWLLLYGTAVLAGGAFSVRIVPVMGCCLMALGAAALFASPAWGDAFMAAGFGALQILFGVVIATKHGG